MFRWKRTIVEILFNVSFDGMLVLLLKVVESVDREKESERERDK